MQTFFHNHLVFQYEFNVAHRNIFAAFSAVIALGKKAFLKKIIIIMFVPVLVVLNHLPKSSSSNSKSPQWDGSFRMLRALLRQWEQYSPSREKEGSLCSSGLRWQASGALFTQQVCSRKTIHTHSLQLLSLTAISVGSSFIEMPRNYKPGTLSTQSPLIQRDWISFSFYIYKYKSIDWNL